MEGLLSLQQKFNEAHKKDAAFGQVTILERYPYPLDAIAIDDNGTKIPVTVSFLGNLTGMSTGQFCTDNAGIQTWVSAARVQIRERNYLPHAAAQGELVSK